MNLRMKRARFSAVGHCLYLMNVAATCQVIGSANQYEERPTSLSARPGYGLRTALHLTSCVTGAMLLLSYLHPHDGLHDDVVHVFMIPSTLKDMAAYD
jgi:hypothetical protein